MVIPTLTVAGMEVMVGRMARKLAARGYEVGIACVEAGGPLVPDLAVAGVTVAVLEARGFAGLDWLSRMSRHFRARAPDILHVHSGCWLKSAIAGRLAGVFPIIHTAHGFVPALSWKERLLERTAVPLTHHVVAVSDHLKADLVGRGIPSRKISVITNGIDTALFDVRQPNGILRRRLGLSPSTCIVGTVARLEPIKNQAMLLDAIASARKAGCDCTAVLIGEGSLRPQLEQRARELGVVDSIHFWGIEADVAALYPEFDIFTLTSTAEGTSISLLEAM